MHVLALAMGFPVMRGKEAQQQQKVDSALLVVERVLASQKTVREGIRSGSIRVDKLVDDALKAAREGKGKG